MLTRRLFELDFVAETTVDDVASALVAESGASREHWRCVVTPNVDHLVRYDRIPAEAEVARTASLVLPDGMPIVWASRLFRRPLSRRLTGADLFVALWRLLADGAIPTVAVASNDTVAARMEAEHAAIRTIVPPMFDVEDDAAAEEVIDRVVAAVDEVGARFVVVGVSMPKHHLIARRLRERWAPEFAERPCVLLLGASPDFAFGLTPRAPQWMQRSGLEWLHRLARDPRRMAKRYLVDDVRFVRLVVREWRRTRG